jgi:AraC-like DNA-binding protein
MNTPDEALTSGNADLADVEEVTDDTPEDPEEDAAEDEQDSGPDELDPAYAASRVLIERYGIAPRKARRMARAAIREAKPAILENERRKRAEQRAARRTENDSFGAMVVRQVKGLGRRAAEDADALPYLKQAADAVDEALDHAVTSLYRDNWSLAELAARLGMHKANVKRKWKLSDDMRGGNTPA